MVLRGCMENALGFYVSRNAGSREIWLRRHDDEKSKEDCEQHVYHTECSELGQI